MTVPVNNVRMPRSTRPRSRIAVRWSLLVIVIVSLIAGD
jgi:hypothetical protein